MSEALLQTLAPWYLQIRFLHILFALIWLGSTAVAFTNYLLPAFRAALKNPEDPTAIRERNRMMERFDRGVLLEHIAFPALLITGIGLLLIGGWSADSLWLVIKLAIVVWVFLPMEAADYWLSHFGGNKEALRRRSGHDDEYCVLPAYEIAISRHWWFLVVTTPVVVVGGLAVLYLATVKPL